MDTLGSTFHIVPCRAILTISISKTRQMTYSTELTISKVRSVSWQPAFNEAEVAVSLNVSLAATIGSISDELLANDVSDDVLLEARSTMLESLTHRVAMATINL